MSESRKRKNRGQQDVAEGPTKQDYAIAKYLRDKCPKKQTLFVNQKVYYFTGSKAVDTLLESKWAKGTKKEDPTFTTRDQCIDYMNKLRDLEFITRAEKIVVKKVESKKEKEAAKDKKKKDKAGKEEKADSAAEDKGTRKRKGAKDKESEKGDKSDEGAQAEPESPKSDPKDGKRKRKIRLDLHPQQVFLDSDDAYVWVYEPTSIMNIVMGVGLVIGAIGVCLFPLWPPIVRQGVYYLSLLAVGLIGLLIAVSLLRYVAFGVVWAATFGKMHFWYLPNLTEDCGFFESFVPLYTCTKPTKDEKTKKKSEKSKDKDSDKEDQDDKRDDDNDEEAAPEPDDEQDSGEKES